MNKQLNMKNKKLNNNNSCKNQLMNNYRIRKVK